MLPYLLHTGNKMKFIIFTPNTIYKMMVILLKNLSEFSTGIYAFEMYHE